MRACQRFLTAALCVATILSTLHPGPETAWALAPSSAFEKDREENPANSDNTDQVLSALEDPDPAVAIPAAGVLQTQWKGDSQARAGLMKTIATFDQWIARCPDDRAAMLGGIVNEWGELDLFEAARRLLESKQQDSSVAPRLVGSESADYRLRAARALGDERDTRAIFHLERMVKSDPHRPAAQQAALALGRMLHHPDAARILDEGYRAGPREAHWPILQGVLSQVAFQPLPDQEPDRTCALTALTILARTRLPGSVEREMARHAVAVLGKSGEPRAVTPLTRLLSDVDGQLDARIALLHLGKEHKDQLKQGLRRMEFLDRGRNAILRAILIQLGEKEIAEQMLKARIWDVATIQAMTMFAQLYGRQDAIVARLKGQLVDLLVEEQRVRGISRMIWGRDPLVEEQRVWSFFQMIRGRDPRRKELEKALISLGQSDFVKSVIAEGSQEKLVAAQSAEGGIASEALIFGPTIHPTEKLIGLLQNWDLFRQEEKAWKSRDLALQALLAVPSHRDSMAGWLANQPRAPEALVEALGSEHAAVRNLAFRALHTLDRANLPSKHKQRLADYREYLRLVDRLRRLLLANESQRVQRFLDSVESFDQALPLAKILTAKDTLGPLAIALASSRHFKLTRGHMLFLWLSALADKEIAKAVGEISHPAITQRMDDIHTAYSILHDLEEARRLFDSGQGEDAETLLKDVFASRECYAPLYAVYHSVRTPPDFRRKIQEVLREFSMQQHIPRGDAVLEPEDPPSYSPSCARRLSRMSRTKFPQAV